MFPLVQRLDSSFRLTIRNVNFLPSEVRAVVSGGFRLTIRNVNSKVGLLPYFAILVLD